MNTFARTCCCLGISLALAPCSGGAKDSALVPDDQSTRKASVGRHLTVNDRIQDLIRHPAFTGFGSLLLPWDGRTHDEGMPLNQIGSLLPYHTEVRPDVVVSALNRMIDDASAGDGISYQPYSEAQRTVEPDLARVALFYVRGKPGAPFAIISPGGGFSYVASLHEGFPYAVEISRHGYNAFVLKYRAGRGADVATQDLAAAISFVRRNAKSLGVSASDYSLWGSSAGARMAAFIGSHGTARYGAEENTKPAAVVIAYTGHSDTSNAEPPAFVVAGEHDGIASPAAMRRRVTALRKGGTVVEYREFENVGHGFGLGTGTSAEGWVSDAVSFWRKSIGEHR